MPTTDPVADPVAEAKARAEAAIAAARAGASDAPGDEAEIPEAPAPPELPAEIPGAPEGGYGYGTYGDFDPPAPDQVAVRSNQNLSLCDRFLVPDTVYNLPNTHEVQAAVAVGALTLVEADAPGE